jgi:hypothetical protein
VPQGKESKSKEEAKEGEEVQQRPEGTLMITNPIKTITLATLAATIALLTAVAGAHAATAPVKLVPSGHFGSGTQSSLPGDFNGPYSVAVAPNGNIYVADVRNYRVQELTKTGEFVLMFGKEVNETKDNTHGASEAEENVCTEAEIKASGVKCKAGVQGAAPGQLDNTGDGGIAVDPVSGDVYVGENIEGEGGGYRVQKFTGEGAFILEIGKEVNEKTKGNLCTEKEVEEKTGVKCTAPASSAVGVSEHGAFQLDTGGNLLAVGGEHDLLYVGAENRVQEFEPDGEWKGEIPLTAISSDPNSFVIALALSKETGDIYLAYAVYQGVLTSTNVIREFDAAGSELQHFAVASREENHDVQVQGMALDAEGRLAITAGESERGVFGSLFDAASGLRITEFTIPGISEFSGIAFNGGDLDAAAPQAHEVAVYVPVPVGMLLTSPVSCAAGPEHESDVTLDCGLSGEVDAWGVKETEVWFQWGRTPSLGETTAPPSPVANVKGVGEEEPLVKVSAPITGIRPNEALYARLVGVDENVRSPELLEGAVISAQAPPVAPHVLGAPSASFIGSSSAVLSGELNPENASTSYEFQYGPCNENNPAKCPESPYADHTTAGESAVYGEVGATLEAVGLQSATTYHYRLAAENAGGAAPAAVEGTPFTTAAAPTVQAATGSASAVTATSAIISGAVSGDGKPATYTFELGVDRGGQTQYGVVFSGAAGASTTPVQESLALTGLQPGTTYAYRIVVSSGYGTAVGASMTFTTAGLPSVLSLPPVLGMLAVPNIAFPKPATSTMKALTNAQKLAKALTACKKRSRKQRAACQKQARKHYPKSKQANNRKKG